jgi:NitT/TauT family transport system ATP-binding protein
MITLNAITFAYPHGAPIFQGFRLDAARGQSLTVLGPSGCGKTTLLYLLAGLQFPEAGQVLVDGLPLRRPRPQTGLILQDYGLLPWFTVLENVRLGLRVRQFYGPDGKHAPEIPAGSIEDARRWIERLGLGGLEGQFPARLSGGQRQRAAIARTLVLRPDLLLMDEPFSSLDAPTRLSLRELTLSLWREQRFTFVVVTHAIEEAAHLGQRILLLGRPPHTQAEIIDNPVFGLPDMVDREEYHALTRVLRERMAAFGAQIEAAP